MEFNHAKPQFQASARGGDLASVGSCESGEVSRSNGSSERHNRLTINDSSWVVFSPDQALSEHILSSSNEDLGLASAELEEYDELDDDSLINSLSTNRIRAAFPPSHEPPQNLPQHPQAEDLKAWRIDDWTKDQERLISQRTRTSSSRSVHDEVLASWGVDDRCLSDTALAEQPERAARPQTPLRTDKTKFYGSDLLDDYSHWEVDIIKKVAKQLSTSLKREHLDSDTSFLYSKPIRRNSNLLHLSTSVASKFLSKNYWRNESNHSSVSTNSIMLNHLSWDGY